jgi:hypothetical protein
MRPAVPANLVRSNRVEAVSGTQLLDQLAPKLGLMVLFLAPNFDLSKPITSAADHQVVKLDALPSATKGIKRLTHSWGFRDRMTRMAGWHSISVAPGTALTEREGFEPSNEVTPVTRFPVAPVQPLRHLS